MQVLWMLTPAVNRTAPSPLAVDAARSRLPCLLHNARAYYILHSS